MDRHVIRFRLLFEYYQDFHSEDQEHGKNANSRIEKMDIPNGEKTLHFVG